MKVTFFFNYLNRHQLPVADEMYELLGDDFKFVVTYPLKVSELKGGEDYSNRPYCLLSCQNDSHKREAINLNLVSDVCLYGAGNLEWERERAKTNKLSFEVSERWLKKGIINIFSPRLLKWWFLYQTKLRRAPYYKLCCGGYVTTDCMKLFTYKNSCFKWGYFTEFYQNDLEKLLEKKRKEKVDIIWVGRMIDWKHPELAISLASYLSKNHYDFTLTLIGNGPMRSKLETLVLTYKLDRFVKILNFIPHTEVRKYMEDSNIFLFTSDRNEGWGAVLNEAMNSGCAVVANKAIGSVPYLIEEGINGLIYDGTEKMLCDKVEFLINNPEKRMQISRMAYKTIENHWNPQNAAHALIKLSKALMNGLNPEIHNGPCSKA